jgi:hypothetical protein
MEQTSHELQAFTTKVENQILGITEDTNNGKKNTLETEMAKLRLLCTWHLCLVQVQAHVHCTALQTVHI